MSIDIGSPEPKLLAVSLHILVFFINIIKSTSLIYNFFKVGAHDKLGSQVVPLKLLKPQESTEFILDLLKNTNVSDPQKKKPRGKIVVELKYAPFREDNNIVSGSLDGSLRIESQNEASCNSMTSSGAGVLMVTVQGAEDVEGERHNNPYALVIFKGETKKSKVSCSFSILNSYNC